MHCLHLQGARLIIEWKAGREFCDFRPETLMADTPLERLLAQRQRFLGFLLRRIPDAGLAEDILQTAYVRALEHQHDKDIDESATAWFYRLLRNAVIDNYRRQEAKSRALEAWARELETTATPSPELEDEICVCLNGVIDGLKPEYAEVLRKVDLGAERLQDFAQQRSLSTSNAGVRAHRARAALRKELIRTCGSCAEHGCLNCMCKKHAGSAQ
jgi:RNA polymerase sigma factor (sigma-70 family)